MSDQPHEVIRYLERWPKSVRGSDIRVLPEHALVKLAKTLADILHDMNLDLSGDTDIEDDSEFD